MNLNRSLTKFDIVSKDGQTIPFVVNSFQQNYLDKMSRRDVILKVRQVGFSSLILGLFTLDFLLIPNSRSVCISHDAPSAQKLLDRVKFFISSAEAKGLSVNLKYNSRNELMNADKNSSFYIGQAGSKSFGRGDTVNNLHLSEFAFYEDPERMLSGVLQALVPSGRAIIETTANGMNFLKTFWDKASVGENNFKAHFFGNTFYSKEFLDEKRLELGDEKFKQEYPATDTEAFLATGGLFFDRTALQGYLDTVQPPIQIYNSFYDLLI